MNYGIMISVKMLHGELRVIKEENALLFKNVCLTSKLGFPDVIMPGDVRNDLYLYLDKGEFERGGKSTGKNIEVSVVVLDSEKKIIKVRNKFVKNLHLHAIIMFSILELLVGCIGNGTYIGIQFNGYLPPQFTNVGRKFKINIAY